MANMPTTQELKGEATTKGKRRPLRELALLYLRLGTTAFGGPAAHIAMMEDEIVRRRRWLTREEFLDLLGVINLLPGPNSTKMAIQIGCRVAGWPGLLMGGLCFILPAALLTLAIVFYVRYGTIPQAANVLYGIKAVMIGCAAVYFFLEGRSGAGTVAENRSTTKSLRIDMG